MLIKEDCRLSDVEIEFMENIIFIPNYIMSIAQNYEDHVAIICLYTFCDVNDSSLKLPSLWF